MQQRQMQPWKVRDVIEVCPFTQTSRLDYGGSKRSGFLRPWPFCLLSERW